jgi:myo-inositol 2-dehydrogenase/D-chiro-inositol 1-dehydrogenase
MSDNVSAALRVALIGAGFISDYHVAGLRAAGGASISAIIGRSRQRTEARARDLGIPRVETDYRNVLDDPAVDAVVIATPDDTHEAIAVDALNAGKAVLLQKPMALNQAQCRRIIDVSAARGGRLTVSFMHRYFPEVRWLRDLLAEGSLGPVHAIRIRNATPGADWSDWFYSPDSVSGGVVMQLGVHGIDLCRHLFGEIASVSALVSTRKPSRILRDGRTVHTTLEDTVAAGYSFASGVVGSHEMSYTEIAGCDRFRLEVYAEHGTVWLRTERGTAALYAPEVTGRSEWVVPALAEEPFGAAHHRHWLAVVRGEVADDTAQSGLASIVVAESIYRSAREGRATEVAYDPGGGEVR